MKRIKFGDVLDATNGIIVHGCNAQGVMGSGLAKAVRAKYPKAFADYADAYTQGGLELGQVVLSEITDTLVIANAITQWHYGRDKVKYVSYPAIQQTFTAIAEAASQLDIEVHYPMIGAGLGGGNWAVISEIIDTAFEPYPDVARTLWIYE